MKLHEIDICRPRRIPTRWALTPCSGSRAGGTRRVFLSRSLADWLLWGSAIYYGGYGEYVSGTDKPGTIRVQLDNATVDVSANIDPKNPAQQILFSKKGLDPSVEHMIYVQKISESGKRDLNIDFFTYAILWSPSTIQRV